MKTWTTQVEKHSALLHRVKAGLQTENPVKLSLQNVSGVDWSYKQITWIKHHIYMSMKGKFHCLHGNSFTPDLQIPCGILVHPCRGGSSLWLSCGDWSVGKLMGEIQCEVYSSVSQTYLLLIFPQVRMTHNFHVRKCKTGQNKRELNEYSTPHTTPVKWDSRKS